MTTGGDGGMVCTNHNNGKRFKNFKLILGQDPFERTREA